MFRSLLIAAIVTAGLTLGASQVEAGGPHYKYKSVYRGSPYHGKSVYRHSYHGPRYYAPPVHYRSYRPGYYGPGYHGHRSYYRSYPSYRGNGGLYIGGPNVSFGIRF